MAKIAFVALMLGLALVNRYVLVPSYPVRRITFNGCLLIVGLSYYLVAWLF